MSFCLFSWGTFGFANTRNFLYLLGEIHLNNGCRGGGIWTIHLTPGKLSGEISSYFSCLKLLGSLDQKNIINSSCVECPSFILFTCKNRGRERDMHRSMCSFTQPLISHALLLFIL